ncbi:methyl-accepting chemotaxis protein [Emcibacter sp.]|uniref:methyl-accepting chemotaxis protein n=1 Tax=Emcibacter sp. TaxID=1979954 RepID=UPI002AA66EAE|nr:methyl-accepting chemotaxis protein [Emcibacter sp.]
MDIEQKKILYRLTPDGIDTLRAAKPVIMALMHNVLDDFYRILQSNDHLRNILGDSDPEMLKKMQKKHWDTIFSGQFDENYMEECRRIGQAHHAIGLDQVSFISGYNFILQRLGKELFELDEPEEKKSALHGLVQSALMLDMGCILSEYASSRSNERETLTAQKFSNEMIDSTIEISMAMNETAIVSSNMVHAIQKVDDNAQRIAAAIEETVVSMNSINQSTQEAASTAGNARSKAADGTAIVEKAYQQTEQIAESVLNSVAQVEALSEASKRIGDIVSQIEDIAGQTNLLALNATIEAARAGEAGRGFAVVASEVKTLSTQTAQATVDIKDRIQSLVKEMTGIVTSMHSAKSEVESGQEVMVQVKEHMSDIDKNIDQLNHLMAEVANVLAEQEKATSEVSSGASNIADESGKNSKYIMEVVESMKDVASLVSHQIEAFGKHEVPNKVLRIAKSDHIIWKKRLRDMMVGLESISAQELSDHHSCRLGKWYYGEESIPYRDHPSFRALETCHRLVHEHGIQAAKDHEKSNHSSAMQNMDGVEQASAEVIKHLDDLIRAFTTKAA